MACTGTAPTITSCDAALIDCTVTLTASVDKPCGSDLYSLCVYRKKDSAPTGLPGELFECVSVGAGPGTYSYSNTDDITGEGCGDWHYLFQIECLSTPSVHGSCTDMVSKADNINVDTFEAALDSDQCEVNFTAQIDIPCNVSPGTASLYKKKGSVPSPSPENLHQAIPTPSGLQNNYTLNFEPHDVRCLAPGTWHYLLEIVTGDGCSSITPSSVSVVVTDAIPTLTNVAVNVADCNYTLNAKVNYACGVEEGRYQVRAYYRYAAAVPAVPPAQSKIGNSFDVPCGPGANVIQWTGTVKADGKHYWKVFLFDRGVIVSSQEVQATINGCFEVTLTPTDGLSVPQEGIDELIYLVRVQRTGAQTYTYTDMRLLTPAYQLITWNYFRNGGCGNFRLLLREYLPEADVALQEGWEVHVRIRLDEESDYSTWYRGTIRAVQRNYEGNEVLTDVRGQGYLEQLAHIQVQKRYPKNIAVDSIVADIVDNFVLPNSRIIRPLTGTRGIDASSYVTQGPLHFECSALKAIKFLAELQGDREFGISATREFYFRAKSSTIEDAIFEANDVVSVVEGGKEVEKVNLIKLGGKFWGHKETLELYRDTTDISNYGMFEKPIDIPHVEHRFDANRWSENVVNRKKNAGNWRTLAWSQIDKRLERNHPDEALGQLRIYGLDISNEILDLDISKITYYKGGFVHKGEVREIHDPKTQSLIDQPVLRAHVYAGLHQHDLVEELEEKVYEPINALKGQIKQFRNPVVDITNPNPNNIETIPGQLWAQPSGTDVTHDVTHGPFVVRFRDDLTNWPHLVKLRHGDVTTPSAGNFLGEEFFVYSDAARTQGTKYFWNGTAWVAMANSTITGVAGGGIAGRVALWKTATELESNAALTAGRVVFVSVTGALTDDAGLTYNAAADALTVAGYLRVGTATDAAAAGDFTAGLAAAGRLWFAQTIPVLYMFNSANQLANQIVFNAGYETIFNEQGADIDFRVEGDNQSHLIFADASLDTVGIGASAPLANLQIDGNNTSLLIRDTASGVDAKGWATQSVNSGGDAMFRLRAVNDAYTDGRNVLHVYRSGILPTSVVWNEDGLDIDFRIEGDNDPNLLFCDASTDRVGIGGSSPGNKLSVVTSGDTYALSLGEESSATGKQLILGYHVTANYGVIQAIHQGTAVRPLIINPNGGNVGIGGTTSPDAALDILSTLTQLRLTYTDGSVYTDFYTNSSGECVVTPSGAGHIFGMEQDLTGSGPIFRLRNSSDTASSYAQLRMEVGGASAADPTLYFAVGANGGTMSFATGIDNSDSDKFKVSYASGTLATLGTNDYLTITTTGLVTVPIDLNVASVLGVGDAGDSALGMSFVWGSRTAANGGPFYGLLVAPDFTEGASGIHGVFAPIAVFGSAITGGGATAPTIAATLYLEDPMQGGFANYLLYGTVSNALTDPIAQFNQGSTGDAMVRLSLGSAHSYAVGIDNTDDSWKVSYAASGAAVLGTNDYLTVSPAGQTILSSLSTLAAQLLTLDQNDTDQPFIDFQGNSAADATASVSTFTTGNAVQGHVQMEINGTKRWFRFYDDPTS